MTLFLPKMSAGAVAYRIAGIAAVSLAKAPTKDQGKKLVKDWVEWSKDMADRKAWRRLTFAG